MAIPYSQRRYGFGGRRTGFGVFRTPLARLRPFTPFKAPAKPPPGTYDPSLDAEERAAERGYGDLQQDTERDRGRLFSNTYDPVLGAIPNLQRQLAEEGADYGRQVQELGRGFQRLGTGQDNAARAAGVDSGGVLAQALRKRTENEAFARVPIDTAHTRYGQQNAREQAQAELGYQRQNEDLGTQLTRGGRELGFYRGDVGAQRFFQAEQSGAELPTAPKNEKTKNGVTYRVRGMGKPVSQRTYRLSTGQVLGRRPFVQMMRKRRGKA